MFKPTNLDHQRIKVIGDMMMKADPGKTAVCCVDADGDNYTGKGDWYVSQFTELYPALIIVGRFEGPTPGVHSIKLEAPPFRRRPSSN